jgi:hypothetical protein
MAAVAALRSPKKAGSVVAAESPPLGTSLLEDRIEAALRSAPPNQQKNLFLNLLLAVSGDGWLPFKKIQAEFEKAGLKASQAGAAIRDLSWQMREYLPPTDVAGLDAPVCVLADRTRSAGVYNYRLSPAGRTAAKRYLA